ncbi:MAG: type II CRISPR-associated endonuclease Cas1 [Bacteroidaceae bacterium]
MIKQTLYFGNPAYLSTKDEQLLMRIPEVEKDTILTEVDKKRAVRSFPIEDIGVVILDDKQITITQGLIDKLLSNNCAVICCDNKRMPSGLLLPLMGNTVQNERFRLQIESSLPLRKQLWQQTVQQKIRNQASVLSTKGDYAKSMYCWAEKVKSGDVENVEGRAAAHYWRHLFPPDMFFVRGQEEGPPNNLLNYGYAILRAVIARSLVASGLLPTFGIHHHNRYNAYCLADDIMEPYRPYVDKLVLEIIDEHKDVSVLSKEIKARLLSIPVLDVRIDGEMSPLMVAASTTTASLYKCFNGESRKIVYPELTL